MLFHEVASASAEVAATSRRLVKVERLAECLRRATPEDVPIVVAYLSGELRQRRTGLGYAALRDLPPPADEPTLELAAVDEEFGTIADLSGPGSTTARRERFTALMARATEPEQRMLAGLVSGDLRQGALDGLFTEAVAKATELPSADVRRAIMLAGQVAPVASAALAHGTKGLAAFALMVGSPVRPMLASSAPSAEEAFAKTGVPAACEWKHDGIRVQIHRSGDDVSIFTRTLDDVTDRLPDIVEAVRALPVSTLIVDGEAIALGSDGRPLPFQRTASRVGRRSDVAAAATETPLSLFLFDCLHLDGDDLISEPGSKRAEALHRVVPDALRTPRLVTDDLGVATDFFDEALTAGHEGLVIKSLSAPYEAGRRGAGWVKLKPHHTFDLVILGVEWGSGRRTGKLSNLHLGARDPDGRYGPPGGFVMLGKTFKGLTDEMLDWQTEKLQELADGPVDQWAIPVRPELVAEIAFDGVQTSPRYPAKVALRFARVIRHRPDKPAAEANTIDEILAINTPSE
ncbi:MAG TPA: ATP-dependent DNA ligase [Jiangellaceae bacterium]